MNRRTLFFAAWALAALLTKTDPGSAHVMSRLGTVESIVDRHTFRLDDSTFIGTIDKIYKDGHFYSHQPPLLSVIEAPVYALLRLPGTRFNNRGRSAMVYAFSLLTNGLGLALTVVVFLEIFTMAGVRSPRREWLALLLPFGTWLLPYGIVTNNHGISGLLTAVLIWLLLKLEWRGSSAGGALGIGLTLGLLVAIEVLPIAAFVPATIAYLWSRRDFNARAWAIFTAGFAAPLAAHASINIPLFGDIIPAGFHSELFQYEGSVFDPASLTGSLKYTSVGAAARYAWAALFVDKGFFTFAPVCLLGLIAGVASWRWWLARAAGPYAVMLAGAVISMAIALLTTNNFGGEAVGFRHAVYLTPIFIVLTLPWLVEPAKFRGLVIGVAGVSALLMLVFAAREPWSVLTLNHPRVGAWRDYLPLVDRIVHATLFTP